MLLLTRCFVGVGEGAYGPLAPTILSDCFPVAKRGKILSLFYVAMPVGGALGYALGGFMAHLQSRRHPCGLGTPPGKQAGRPGRPTRSDPGKLALGVLRPVIPGLILGILALLMREPPTGAADAVKTRRKMTWRDYRILLETPSFVLDTLGMTAMSFGMGALAWWMPDYLDAHQVPESVGHRAADRIRAFSLPWADWAGPWSAACSATGCGRRLPRLVFPRLRRRLAAQRALRAAVPGHAVSLGVVHDLRGGILHVPQHGTDAMRSWPTWSTP